MLDSDEEWAKDDHIKEFAGYVISQKMAEHRDELVRDLAAVVSTTVPDQVKNFAYQFVDHDAASKLAEGVQQLPRMAREALERFCTDKLDADQRKFQEQLDGYAIRFRACESRLGEHDTALQTL
eukprot:8226226-Pyramimonas_sp.AAC.1